MAKCIWCKEDHSTNAVEHIVPDAIGNPLGFVLQNGEVCTKCNNELAYLDREIADTFDVLTFHYDVPRKGNRPPAVLSRGNFVAQHTNEGKTYLVNMDPQSVDAPHHVRLGAYGRSERNIKAELKHSNNTAEVTYSVEIRISKNFVRGLHKIALEALSYFLGPTIALDVKHDAIRSYVREGLGDRKALGVLSSDTSFHNRVWAPYLSPDGCGYTLCIRLAVLEFVVDLTSALSEIPKLLEKQQEHDVGKVMILPTTP